MQTEEKEVKEQVETVEVPLGDEDEEIVKAVRESVDLQRKRQSSTAETPDNTGEAPVERLTDENVTTENFIEGQAVDVQNITTDKGDVKVEVHGDPKKPAIVTYHDVGLTPKTCWNAFVNYPGFDKIFAKACVVHVYAPGQHEGAGKLHERYKPTTDDLVDQIHEAVGKLGIRFFVAMGVGAGAHVMLHYALKHPKPVRALVFISGSASSESFLSWGKGLVSKAVAGDGEMPPRVVNSFVTRFFSEDAVTANTKLVQKYREEIAKLNPANVAHFNAVINSRQNLLKRVKAELKLPVMCIAGKLGSRHQDVIDFYSQLEPSECRPTLVEVPDTADLCHIENPEPIREALQLWLYTLGI